MSKSALIKVSVRERKRESAIKRECVSDPKGVLLPTVNGPLSRTTLMRHAVLYRPFARSIVSWPGRVNCNANNTLSDVSQNHFTCSTNNEIGIRKFHC